MAWSLLSRAMTLGVRVLVIDEENQVLLVRHTYIGGWHFPGGGVERGETLAHAAKKELREECNIETLSAPSLFSMYKNPISSPFDHVALYLVKDWKALGEKLPDHEIAEMRFFPMDDLPNGLTKSSAARLEEVFNDQPVREIW